MPGFLVPLEKGVMLLRKARLAEIGSKVAVFSLRAALTFVGSKFGHWDTYRFAGLAMVTVGTVHKVATSAKTLVNQITVCRSVNFLAWACNLRAGDAAFKVTAWIGSRCVILNLTEGRYWAVCHALADVKAAS